MTSTLDPASAGPPATAGVVFVNPSSGPDDTHVGDLRDRFPGHDVVECAADGFAGQVAGARDRRPAFVGVAGGDGTLRAAAEHLVGTDVALLAIPTGTRNHFAKDLGIPDVDTAAAAGTAAAPARRRIGTGEVNGRTFLNNSSIGIYPKIVIRREAREHRLPKGVAQLVAAWEQLRHGRHLDVEVAGERLRAWLVFVGNGEYGEGLLDLADRESVDGDVLDVRVVRADMPLARLRVVGALLLGRLARSPLVVRHRTGAITIDTTRAAVEVALDGEVEMLETPLRYRARPASLDVIVP